MNTELIEQEFDDKDLHNRPGSYGKLLTYISYPAYVRRMNEVFDYQWSSDLVQLDFKEDEVIAVVKVTAEGISKTQAGGKRITKGKNGNIVSLGDDVKACITTAFKKAAQMFGIGIYLAEGDDEDVTRGNGRPTPTTSRTNSTISENQLKLIKEIRTEMEMEPDEVQNLAMEMFKLAVTELNKTQASTFIQSLKMAKQNGKDGQSQSETPF